MNKNEETLETKKRVKGSGKGKVAGGIGAVGVIAALIALLSGKIPGLGSGTTLSTGKEAPTTTVTAEQNETTSAETTAAATETTTVTTAAETAAETTTTTKGTTYVDVTVNGNSYTYQNRSYADTDLEKLTAELGEAVKNAEGDAVIRITNQDSSLNAYQALTEKLNADSLRFEEVKP